MTKRNGNKRMCVDLRPLNERIYKQKYPFPLIEDHSDRLYNKKIFSLLDMKDGFHQIDVHPDDTKYFSFATPNGQFEYVKLPFGYSEAPAEFQRRIVQIFAPLIREEKLLVYIDDLLIATRTIEENLKVLEQVLISLKQHGLELNYGKCAFLKTQIEYLGYIVSGDGISMSNRHTQAILDYPKPRNLRQLQGFLGLCNYFRRDYSIKAKPLYQLTKKNKDFVLDQECNQAISALKSELTSFPVLRLYNPRAHTELHSDASSYGLGAILLQRQDDGRFAPIAYFSKTTTDVERRYHSYE